MVWVFRKKHNNSNIKFYLPVNLIEDNTYNKEFFNFLKSNWDYFSPIPGNTVLPYEHIMLWDFRDTIGDVVDIQNNKIQEKKLTVFPLLDATYNTLRNWPIPLLSNIIKFCSINYPTYKKIICIKELPNDIDICDFEISNNFLTNIEHIMTTEVYVGGDTGMSHFASALNRGPKELIYFYTCRGMIHSLPFHLFSGKGVLNTYSTQYNINLF